MSEKLSDTKETLKKIEKLRKEGKAPPIVIDLSLPMGPPRKVIGDAAPSTETAAAEPAKSEGTLWYPEFQLASNPFVTFEARIERGGLVIKVPMFERIESFISARSSAIIEGERGCGKTSVVAYFAARGADITTSISPRSAERIKDSIRGRVALKIGADGKKIVGWATEGQYGTPENYYRWKKAVDEVARGGHLLDVPDNFSHKAAFELADLCVGILDKGGFIIFFATLGQARMLRRLDTFARFPVLKFERPSGEFFRELFFGRATDAKVGPFPLFPLKEEAIDKVAGAADYNPRRFILLCSRLLIEMRERKMDRPLDEKAADELLKDADVLAEAPVDIEEALREIMREFGKDGTKWIKVKDIHAILLERYGLNLDPRTVGRRLTEMGCPRRHNPDAEYLAAGTAEGRAGQSTTK